VNAILYVSEDGFMAGVPFSLYDSKGLPLTVQVDQLQAKGLRLNTVDWWLQAVIAGKDPDWAFDTLREAMADNSDKFVDRKEWDFRMARLYTVAAKGQRDPQCWESMLQYIRSGKYEN
jgi:hypothetical protein